LAYALFTEGVPAKITVEGFKREHLQSFPRFANHENDGIIENAINAVYSMFTGVSTLWDTENDRVWYDKTVQCYGLLAAWYIVNIYPQFARGIQAIGGVDIVRKKIDGIDITFAQPKDTSSADDVLNSLRSNPFGKIALMMIRSNPKHYKLRVSRFVG